MADTIEEKCMADIVTALKSVTALKTVERDRVSPLDIQSFPAAILLDLDSTPESVPTSVTRLELNILVELWVSRQGSAISSATVLNEIAGNVDKKILEDPRRGGNAQNTTFQGRETVFAVANEQLRGVQLRYQIQTRHKTGDAFSAPA